MDQRTRDALEASIKHWQANAAANDVSNASLTADDCELCNTFNVGIVDGCKGCPVMQRTGLGLCESTPFRAAWLAFDDWQDGIGTASDFRNAARAELDFLISLRPPEAFPSTPS